MTIVLNGATGITTPGDLNIVDKIVHSDDTNTAIRFPEVDTVSVETNGVERMRINSLGYIDMPAQPVIAGQIGTALINPIAGPGLLAFNEFWVSRGIAYNSTTRRFTVPVAGIYRITLNPFKLDAATYRVLVGINTDTPTNASNYGSSFGNATGYETGCINSVVTLQANDYIVFYLQLGNLYNIAADKFNQFSIQKIA